MNPSRSRLLLIAALALALAGLAGAGAAQGGGGPHVILGLSYTDPVGDQSGPVDVTGMLMTWDASTGAYTIMLTADAAHAFTGQFRIDVNLYERNPPTGVTFVSRECMQSSAF